MFKNVASQKVALFAFDITTGAPKTGDSANITPYVAKDYGSVTALGTATATEMDATNAKGWYSFTLAQAETNGDALLFTAKSSTSNVSFSSQLIFTTPANFSTLVVDGSGRVDIGKIGGTSQTAVDIGSVGTAIKTQTDKMAFTVPNQIDSNVIDWKGATAPAMTGDAYARLGAPAGASVSADIAAVPTANANADALLNRDMSVGSDSGSPTVRTVRQALRFLRNKWAISTGTLTVYKEDDTTSSWTATVATDGSALPIVSNDPA